MSVFRTSKIGDFTRGGQTSLHFLRMIRQVVDVVLWVSVVVFVVLAVAYVMYSAPRYELYLFGKWIVSKIAVVALGNPTAVVPFTMPDGREISARLGEIVTDPYIISVVNKVFGVGLKGAYYSVLSVISLALSGLVLIYRLGKRQRTEDRLRGGYVVEAEELREEIKRRGIDGKLRVCGVPMVEGTETSHMLVAGSPGSGKSVAIKDMLRQIRSRGDRAIVYDIAGEFIEAFYREGKDVILNPLDSRCASWEIWNDAVEPPDFDNVAASLIPESKSGDPFWVLAARTLFSTVAYRMSLREDRSTKQLLMDLLTIDLLEAAKLVKGTEGAAILAQGAEKTALSVRATLAAYIRSLKYLRPGGEGFSIKKWVSEDKGDGWIFIASRPDQKETLKPLITTWLDIASSSIMSLPPDLDRRIWMVIDELPSLNKLPTLPETLALSRKYGGSVLIAFQSYSQLADVYGNRGAESLTGLCSSWVVYRANEPATAEWAAKALGSQEVMEKAEGLSYGANEIRDGVSLSASRQMRQLVLPVEITNLPNLTGYLRLPGDLPLARFTLQYEKYKSVAPAFVKGDLADTAWGLSLPVEVEEGVAVATIDDDDVYRSL